MSELLTNFKDDILAESMEGRRRYQMITNEDGTVSFVDVTEYEQIGSEFGQAEVNAIHREINRKFDSGDVVDPLAAEESGFAADAKLTGDALREVSANIEWKLLASDVAYNISTDLPEKFDELCIIVNSQVHYGGMNYYNINILGHQLSNELRVFSTGSYINDANSLYIGVRADISQIVSIQASLHSGITGFYPKYSVYYR